ncbi:hypothetical protein SADUNF_Sadunf04G0108200 [Salix dunnii]|uniref:PI3K/PI4K catalytic domain-containing protein n=1 Tax=Salix dunnii TaxID=1413687 RepID=A0A835KB74_9ROSI|nr:hypothetical protein SADUNF_Sadunf04G0108200 [Salix dunnii]
MENSAQRRLERVSGHLLSPIEVNNGLSQVHYVLGGVARNIAECMSKLGTKPYMISALGNDMAGNFTFIPHTVCHQNHLKHSCQCSVGRLVHIDFGFILETSPGGNMRFESAHFKLSHEMTQLLDPSGVLKSETWLQFVSLCVKGYLAARRYMDGIINTVMMMLDSGLPCFSRGDPIGNLRKRFHPEMSEREAANFMIRVCTDAYNKWTTAGYDLIQYIQQGIEK